MRLAKKKMRREAAIRKDDCERIRKLRCGSMRKMDLLYEETGCEKYRKAKKKYAHEIVVLMQAYQRYDRIARGIKPFQPEVRG